jgi:ribokinase
MRITVVGSFVTDLVCWVPWLPRQGETLPAERCEVHAGGKGFNQALAARRMGAEVAMVGMLGEDAFGHDFRLALDAEGIDHRFVGTSPAGTSVAVPMILPSRQNSILLVQRANLCLTAGDVHAAAAVIGAADVVMLQQEIPASAGLAAARLAADSGAQVIVNPAPAGDETPRFIAPADWLIPNEIEASALTGLEVTDMDSAVAAARQLLDRGVRRGVVVTLGDQGAVAVSHDHPQPARVPALAVDAVDPTGAGDAFCGAFAASLADDLDLAGRVRLACAAAAISTTRAGASSALPDRSTVAHALRSAEHPGGP